MENMSRKRFLRQIKAFFVSFFEPAPEIMQMMLPLLYPMDFKMHRDGKGVNPREHSKLCDWGYLAHISANCLLTVHCEIGHILVIYLCAHCFLILEKGHVTFF